MFCLDNKRKIESIIACYCQLVAKKQDLQREIEKTLITLEQRKPEYEAEQENMLLSIFHDIDTTIQTLTQTEATPFELTNLPEHLARLHQNQQQLESLEAEIDKCQEWTRASISSNL